MQLDTTIEKKNGWMQLILLVQYGHEWTNFFLASAIKFFFLACRLTTRPFKSEAIYCFRLCMNLHFSVDTPFVNSGQPALLFLFLDYVFDRFILR